MNKQEKIAFIKSYKEPPHKREDPYYERYPWQKFGGISSGIGMGWCWFRDDVIDEETTEEDIETAYMEIKSKQSEKKLALCYMAFNDVLKELEE